MLLLGACNFAAFCTTDDKLIDNYTEF